MFKFTKDVPPREWEGIFVLAASDDLPPMLLETKKTVGIGIFDLEIPRKRVDNLLDPTASTLIYDKDAWDKYALDCKLTFGK